VFFNLATRPAVLFITNLLLFLLLETLEFDAIRQKQQVTAGQCAKGLQVLLKCCFFLPFLTLQMRFLS